MDYTLLETKGDRIQILFNTLVRQMDDLEGSTEDRLIYFDEQQKSKLIDLEKSIIQVLNQKYKTVPVEGAVLVSISINELNLE